MDISKYSCEELINFLEVKGISKETTNIILGAGLNGETVLEFEREDIQDLLPGPNLFLARRGLWKVISEVKTKETAANTEYNGKKRMAEILIADDEATPSKVVKSSPHHLLSASPSLASPKTPGRICGTPMIAVESISFPLYSDPGLIEASVGGKALTTDDRNRLIRNQVAMMRAECASLLQTTREPAPNELLEVAKALIKKYPSLADDPELNPLRPWDGLLKQLKRRLANVKPIRNPQGKTPKRSKVNRRLGDGHKDLEKNTDEIGVPQLWERDLDRINDSDKENGDNISRNDEEKEESDDDEDTTDTNDSQMQRHYCKLQEQFKLQKPNKGVLAQLLKLELPGRRNFIQTIKGDICAKTSQLFEAYPCFKSVDECIREIQRLVSPTDEGFTNRILGNMEKMWDKLIYFGLFKQIMAPPQSSDIETKACLVLENFHKMFPAKRTKKGVTMIQKLEMDEDLDKVIKAIKDPKILKAEDSLLLCVGGKSLHPLAKDSWTKAVVGMMGLYYLLHMYYPSGLETALLFLQTEVLEDMIHSKDKTPIYKESVNSFYSFSAPK